LEFIKRKVNFIFEIKMSIVIPVKSLKNLKKIASDLVVHPTETKFNLSPQPVFPYIVEGDERSQLIYAPFHYGVNTIGIVPFLSKNKEKWGKFTGQLRTEQKDIVEQAQKYLDTERSCLISLKCGGGKTVISLYLASLLQARTLFITHRVTLKFQTLAGIKQFFPDADAYVIDGITLLNKFNKNNLNPTFTVASVKNLAHLPAKFLDTIEMVIIDECHSFVSPKSYTPILKHLHPAYLLGLSATPNRTDGMGKVLDFLFGPVIVYKPPRSHTVYRLKTEYEPVIEMKNGHLDWHTVLESQANNIERNKFIVKLVKYFSTRNFLILCKRISQAKMLLDLLLEAGEKSTILIESQRTYNIDARVLVSTYSKAGVGFDHPKLDTLIVAADVDENIEQYHGRIFRRVDSDPFVIDLVDKHGVFDNHWRNRRKFYLEAGAVIKNFHQAFPCLGNEPIETINETTVKIRKPKAKNV
jgi:superfamily II DNA or RNA helicase